MKNTKWTPGVPGKAPPLVPLSLLIITGSFSEKFFFTILCDFTFPSFTPIRCAYSRRNHLPFTSP